MTTVFDCLRVGGEEGTDETVILAETLMTALEDAAAHGALRAEHRTHLRCEICCEGVVEATERLLSPHGGVGLLSLMDHTPGQRQDRDLARLSLYYRTRRGMSEEAIAAMVAERQASAAARCRRQPRGTGGVGQGARRGAGQPRRWHAGARGRGGARRRGGRGIPDHDGGGGRARTRRASPC